MIGIFAHGHDIASQVQQGKRYATTRKDEYRVYTDSEVDFLVNDLERGTIQSVWIHGFDVFTLDEGKKRRIIGTVYETRKKIIINNTEF